MEGNAMNRTTVVALLGAIALLAGCQKEKKQMRVQEATEPEPIELRPVEHEGRVVPAARPFDPEEPTFETGDATPPPPPVEPDTEPVEPAQRTHTIRKGDTLWSIAVKYLGDGQRYPEIVKLNGGLDPRKLRVGQVIKLPPE
jgi:nucleoid-associated protein YgaU